MKSIQVSKENWQKISEIRRNYCTKTNNDVITAFIDLYEQYMRGGTDEPEREGANHDRTSSKTLAP